MWGAGFGVAHDVGVHAEDLGQQVLVQHLGGGAVRTTRPSCRATIREA